MPKISHNYPQVESRPEVLYVKVTTRARREESSNVKLLRTIIEDSHLTSASPTPEPSTGARGGSKSILAEKMTLKQCST